MGIDWQWWILSALSFPAEFLLHSNYTLCFWGVFAVAAVLISPLCACLVLLGAVFALLASFGQREGQLPRYKGELDILLGRSYRASTLTPDLPANNNVTIAHFGDKLVVAYRKAKSHFASPTARLAIATASPLDLENWEVTWEHTTGEDDLREMMLFDLKGKMFLFFARLAPNKRGFLPRRMQWACSEDLRVWTKPTDFGSLGEIVWDVKTHEHQGERLVYKVSYTGNHYLAGAVLCVLFEKSADGLNWSPVGKDALVHRGGISEVSFAFTASGDLVAIGRNEDGDHTGFGSQLFFARKEALGEWTALKVSLPHRFDSPRLVNMDGDLLLFARYAREAYHLAPTWLPFEVQRMINLVAYSLLPKAAAVYHLCPPDQDGVWPKDAVELIRTFTGTYGDTGFFSLAKADHSDDWIIANYSSMCHSHASWIYGQVFPTDIYVCRCHFIRRRH